MEKNLKDVKIQISSLCFFLYFLYFVLIQVTVFYDFFTDLIGYTPKNNLSSRFFILIILIVLIFFFHKKVNFNSISYTKTQIIIGIFYIVCISFTKIIYPDTTYDTLNYHLIIQRQGFSNFFSENLGFARGNFQIWGFPLGDKAFWYFRKFLGYRLGTLLNSICIFVLYIQINQIFNILFLEFNNTTKPKFKYINQYSKVLFSLIIISSHYILLNIGTYMVDLLAIPFIMECIIILLNTDNSKKNNAELLYYSLLCGVSLSLKLTNIVYIIPLSFSIISKKYKSLNFKIVIICVLIAIIPCCPFLIYNYSITKNPIFPYYNKYFQSPFFPNINFKDNRFGPKTQFQSVFWLLYFIMPTNTRLSEISSKWNFLYFLGLLGLVIWFCIFAKKEQIQSKFVSNFNYLAFITIGITVLWSFTSGYARYFEAGMILLGFFSYYFLYNLFHIGKRYLRNSLIYFFQITCCIILLSQSFYTIRSFIGGREWSWRHFNTATIKENAVLLFKDKMKSNDVCDKTFYITDNMYCGVADYISHNSKIYNLSYLNNYLPNESFLLNLDDEYVYDIKDSNFIINDQYTEIFENYNYTLQDSKLLNIDFGKYLLIKFKKKSNL